jgi:hypothetical protein
MDKETMTLYLNSPAGYPFAEKIEKTEISRLKSFLINLTPDEHFQNEIRAYSDEQLYKSLEDSGFTFDEEWRGVIEVTGSRLDDPDYARKMGFRQNV